MSFALYFPFSSDSKASGLLSFDKQIELKINKKTFAAYVERNLGRWFIVWSKIVIIMHMLGVYWATDLNKTMNTCFLTHISIGTTMALFLIFLDTKTTSFSGPL